MQPYIIIYLDFRCITCSLINQFTISLNTTITDGVTRIQSFDYLHLHQSFKNYNQRVQSTN